MRDVVLSSDYNKEPPQMGYLKFGLFENAVTDYSFTPYFPVYTRDEEFLGVSCITKKGLAFFSYLDDECYANLDNCIFVLRDYKMYADIEPGTMWEPVLLPRYQFSRQVKPIFAIPGNIGHSDKITFCVKSVYLYNLTSDTVLELDLHNASDCADFEKALPFIDNVICTADSITIRISDDPFSVDEVMGTTEERALWLMNNNSRELANGFLGVHNPSKEYRLLCPSFRLRIFSVSEETGTDKLSIYNLPVCNELHVAESTSDKRKVHLLESCKGSVVFSHDTETFHNCVLDVTSDGSLAAFYSADIKECTYRLKSCHLLRIRNSKSCTTRVESVAFAEIVNCGLSQLELHGKYVSLSKCEISFSKLSDVSCLKLRDCSVNITKLHDIDALYSDGESDLLTVELRNIHYMRVPSGCFRQCTLYAGDNTIIDLDVLKKKPIEGTMTAHLSSSRLNFCTKIDSVTEFSRFIGLLFNRVKGISQTFDKKFCLVVEDCSSNELDLIYTVYLEVNLFEILSKIPVENANYAALLVLAAMGDLRLAVPEGTICKLHLKLSPITSEMSECLYERTFAGADKVECSDTLPSNMDTFHLDMQNPGYEFGQAFQKEFDKECRELGIRQDISSYASVITQSFEWASIQSIDVDIFR